MKTILRLALVACLFMAGLIIKLDFDAQNRLSKEVYQIALEYYKGHKDQFDNRDYLTVIDYTKPSYYKRMHIVHLSTGKVSSYLVAHGSGRGGIGGKAKPPGFSNVPESYLSSLGFVRTGEVYQGQYGRSMRLDGLEQGINHNIRRRAIVLHKGPYVSYEAIWANFLKGSPRVGETLGCPAVGEEYIDEVIDKIHGKSLIYIHSN